MLTAQSEGGTFSNPKVRATLRSARANISRALAMVRTTIPGRRYRRRAVGVPARLCSRGRRRCYKVPRDTARWRGRSVRSLVAPSSTISSRTFVSHQRMQTTRSLIAPPAGALEHQAPLRTAPHARTIILTCMGLLARASIAAPSRRLRTAHHR